MTDKEVQEKTYKSLFQKLQYVVNLTKVKLDMKSLQEKKLKEDQLKQQAKLDEAKKDCLIYNQTKSDNLSEKIKGLNNV